MTSPILLTGGTGTLGRLTAPLLLEAGVPVRVLTRHTPSEEARDREGDGAAASVETVVGDLTTGAGVDAAVAGVETIVHCAGTAKGDEDKARTLVRAAVAAGARHLVFISVVGADRVPVVSRVDRAMFGYFASKLAAERVVAESGLPWTTLRATQFHDLTLATVKGMTRLPVVPVPQGFRFQPVDAGEVAARLVELALGEPAGLVPDLAGPQVYTLRDLVRSYLQAAGKRRLLVPLPLGGRAARAVRSGVILAPDHPAGRRTWEDFLAERVSPRTDARPDADRSPSVPRSSPPARPPGR
jgi:uncharacterized protein YbjT (DUF2867 family)